MSRRKTKKKAQTPSSTAAAHEAAASPPTPGLNTGEDAAPEARSSAPIDNDSTQSRLVSLDPASTSPAVPPSVSSSDDTNLSTTIQPIQSATDDIPSSATPHLNLQPPFFNNPDKESKGPSELDDPSSADPPHPLPPLPP